MNKIFQIMHASSVYKLLKLEIL